MAIIRWFALDSILVVIAIQLFLTKISGQFQWFNLVGLCSATSLFYLIDRYIDLKFIKKDTNNRHYIYNNKECFIILSLIPLIGVSFIFWIGLKAQIKGIYVMCFFGYVLNLILLKIYQKACVKNILVALIFSTAMCGLYINSIGNLWKILIFFFVYFNLYTHQIIEKKISKFSKQWWLLFVLIICLIVYISRLNSLVIAWLIVLSIHGLIIKKPHKYWFEIGEVSFSLPFIAGYLLY